jgi:hypothetical protein
MSVVIKEEFAFLDDQIIFSAAAAILAANGNPNMDAILGLVTDETEGVTAGEYLLVAIASPLLDSFANDDGVDDNNGELDGYGYTDRMGNMTDNFVDTTLTIGDKLYTILRYLIKILNIWMAK